MSLIMRFQQAQNVFAALFNTELQQNIYVWLLSVGTFVLRKELVSDTDCD